MVSTSAGVKPDSFKVSFKPTAMTCPVLAGCSRMVRQARPPFTVTPVPYPATHHARPLCGTDLTVSRGQLV